MNGAFDATIWVSFSIGKHLLVLSDVLLDPVLSENLLVHGCEEITNEYKRVMERPKLKKYVNHQRVLETLELMTRVVEERIIISDVVGSRELKDNYLLALSEKVPLNYLITGDKDLLVLQQWRQTQISSFATFVKLVQQKK